MTGNLTYWREVENNTNTDTKQKNPLVFANAFMICCYLCLNISIPPATIGNKNNHLFEFGVDLYSNSAVFHHLHSSFSGVQRTGVQTFWSARICFSLVWIYYLFSFSHFSFIINDEGSKGASREFYEENTSHFLQIKYKKEALITLKWIIRV